MLIDPPVTERRPRRFPFDRVGVLALAWAALFVAAAMGLTFLLA